MIPPPVKRSPIYWENRETALVMFRVHGWHGTLAHQFAHFVGLGAERSHIETSRPPEVVETAWGPVPLED